MAQVRSANPFALLGDDGEDSAPVTAPKAAPAAAPAAQKPIVGARQPQKKQKNQADKRVINPDAPAAPGDLKEERAASFGVRGRGGRGGRGRGAGNPRSNAGTYLGGDRPRRENGGGRVFDRQSQTGHKDSDKAEAQGWGAEESQQELEAEKLGEADAQADGAATPAAVDGASTPVVSAAPVEEEDNSQTYAEYLAAQAARQLNIALPEARKIEDADEIKGRKAVKKGEQEEEEFLAQQKKAAKAPKEKKTKTFLEVEFRHQPPRRDGEDGVRGGRGGRGRGEGRGRGRGEGRGGGRGRGGRGGNANGVAQNGSSNAGVNLDDNTAFPTL
ncbi:BQ2448_908 [Microbotryum intermedium]|uniref:BQ2448_908 protein n=1 Tax=Microbotryum intermedium TaxID=269621 RepID=A0A238F6L1_9BASI|nr:BQ2448_908 [Microbotryum intermedium]